MERAAFLLKTTETRRCAALDKLQALLPDAAAKAQAAGAGNFSVWQAENLIFGYYEADTMAQLRKAGESAQTGVEHADGSVVQGRSPLS